MALRFASGAGTSRCAVTGWVRSSHVEVLEADDGSIWLRTASGTFSHVKLTRAEWDAFTAGIKDGRFDQLTGDTP